jgi:hypothetical protein
MHITSTTPAVFYDSFTVEIETILGDLDDYGHVVLGPFKRLEHWDNLENLLQLLETMKSTDFFENYNDVLGFLQWFNPEVATLSALDDDALDTLEMWGCILDTEDEAEMKTVRKAFALSHGFVKRWPLHDDGGDPEQHQIESYKVFYHDPNGIRFNTEIRL